MESNTEHTLSPEQKRLIASGANYVTLNADLRAREPSEAFKRSQEEIPDRLQELAERLSKPQPEEKPSKTRGPPRKVSETPPAEKPSKKKAANTKR